MSFRGNLSSNPNWLYRNLIKRNSSYFALILVGAIVMEATVSKGVDTWWHMVNRGRTWEDFKKTQLPKIQAKKAAAAAAAAEEAEE